MYLAKDRILCLELMCQEKRTKFLRYVKESIAETDVPESLNELWLSEEDGSTGHGSQLFMLSDVAIESINQDTRGPQSASSRS